MMRRFLAALLAAALLLTLPALAEYRQLQKGDRDTSENWDVFSLQTQLIQLGYLSGTADGDFGSRTETALKDFQEANGLEATGIADVETQKLLFSDQNVARATPTPAPLITTAPADGTADASATAAPADAQAGNDTYIVQQYLYNWGFSDNKPDGKFGNQTKADLSGFQKYAISDMQQYTNAQRAAAAAQVTPEPTPAATIFSGEIPMAQVEDQLMNTIPTDGTLTADWLDYILNGFDPVASELKNGETSAEVKRMQRRLKALKYIAAGVDGGYGAHTELAVKYFQKRNGLSESGQCDQATLECMYSNAAVESDVYVSKYMAKVSVSDQRVYIYEWTGSDYSNKVHSFVCSTGTTANPTPLGTFQAPGRNGEWYWMADSYVWVRYAFVIDGGIFFHSVLYPTKSGEPTKTSVRNLGKRASHGCIRLSVEDAKWIYDNCYNGMTVVIYE